MKTWQGFKSVQSETAISTLLLQQVMNQGIKPTRHALHLHTNRR